MADEIDYSTVIEMGFETEQMNDQVFFNEYGFQWFLVTLKLSKKITIYWNCNERTIKALRCNNDGGILGTINFKTLQEVKTFINFYKN